MRHREASMHPSNLALSTSTLNEASKARYIHLRRQAHTNRYVCVYIYIYMAPPKIYDCRLHSISCLLTHTCTLVISVETTVDIDNIACILEYIQPCCDASCVDTSTDLRPNSANRNSISCIRKAEAVRKYCASFAVVLRDIVCLHFVGCERIVTVHHGHCVSVSAIEGCARTCSHVTLLHLHKNGGLLLIFLI